MGRLEGESSRLAYLEDQAEAQNRRLTSLGSRLDLVLEGIGTVLKDLQESEGETVKKRGELEDCVLRQMDTVTDLKVRVDLHQERLVLLERYGGRIFALEKHQRGAIGDERVREIVLPMIADALVDGRGTRLDFLEDRVEEMDRSAREADGRVDLLEKLMGGLEVSVDIHRKRLGDLEWGEGEHARARRELAKAAERVKATEPALTYVQQVIDGLKVGQPDTDQDYKARRRAEVERQRAEDKRQYVTGTLLARLSRARRLVRDTEVGDPDRTMVITLLDWMGENKLLTVSQELLKRELEG